MSFTRGLQAENKFIENYYCTLKEGKKFTAEDVLVDLHLVA